jgi:hypothetical protein
MSQPAISNGRLFIAYPAGQHKPKHIVNSESFKPGKDVGYKLLAVDLKTEHHLWEQDIPTDVRAMSDYYPSDDSGSFLSLIAMPIVWGKQKLRSHRSSSWPATDGVIETGEVFGADVRSPALTSSTQRPNSDTPTLLTGSLTLGITPSGSELQKRLLIM